MRKPMRQPKPPLPKMFGFHRQNGDGARVAMTCGCGEVMTERPGHVGENESSCEVRCPACNRLVKLLVTIDVAASGGAPGTGGKR